jgi:PII-like signaling protein
MRHYLIVANRTLGGQQLIEKVQACMEVGEAHFHVLVPVSPLGDSYRMHEGVAEAKTRLEQELARLREIGAEPDGELLEADPFEAVQQVLQRAQFDEIILCTLPPGLSRWLGLDLPHRIQRAFHLPVTHIIAPSGLHSRIRSRGVRLSIYVDETDQTTGGRPLYSEIVRQARDAGLAGATVLRGIEGFGASSVIHTARLLTLSEDLPVVVIIVDTEERIERFLPILDNLMIDGLVVREEVDVVLYSARPAVGE